MHERLGIIDRSEGVREVPARAHYLHGLMAGSGLLPPSPPRVSRDVEMGVFPSPASASYRKPVPASAPPPHRSRRLLHPAVFLGALLMAATGVGLPVVVIVYAAAHPASHWSRRLLRATGLLSGVLMVATGAGLLAAASLYGASDTDTSKAFPFAASAAAVLVLGLLAVRLCLRPMLQFVLMLGGCALAYGGAQAFIVALLFRGDDFSLNPTRAAVLGAALPVTGVATAAILAYRWYANSESRRQWPDVARWASSAYAALLLLVGLIVVATLQAGGGADDTSPALIAATSGAAIPLALVPGMALALHGATISGYPGEGRFRFPSGVLLLALFAAVIAAGAVIVRTDSGVWSMGLLHALAAMLPAAVLIAWASRGGLLSTATKVAVSNRQLWLALALGIAVVTALAGTIDSLIASAMSLAVFMGDGALDRLRDSQVDRAFQRPDLYLSRGAAVVLVLGVVAFMVPIMEEGFKAIGVALVLPKRASRSTAFTLGVIVGAGFGITEASLYGLYGLDDGAEIGWWGLMLVRGGATSLHALNTGLVGLALVSRRASNILRFYLSAVVLHGLWNGMAVLAGSRIIFSLESLTDRQLTMLSLAVLAVLAAANLYIFSRTVSALYRPAPLAS